MPRRLFSLVLATTLLAATPVHADNSEICDRIFRSLERTERAASERAERTGSLWNFLWVRSRSPARLPEPRARQEPGPPFPEAEYWVTIEPGTARGPDCSQGLVKSIFYLPGLVVRPVLSLGDDDVLLVTEHGLYAILPKQHLQPITADTHYIFSDGIADNRLCINSASLNPDCDALLPSVDIADPSTGSLHAIFSYIHGRSSSDMDERRRLYLRSHYDNRLPDDEDERALLCDRFTAGSLFSRARTTDPMPTIDHVPGYKAVSMSLCTNNTSDGATDPLARRGGIKIVTLEGAKESFSVAFQTVFLRRSDQILDLSKAVDVKRLRSRKACSEELTISDFQTIGASGSATINALVIEAGVKVELQTRRSFTQNFKDLMFVISVHTDHPDKLNSIEQFFRKTYDIWTLYGCENGSVTQPTKIVLYHELPRDSYFELDAQALRTEYESYYGKRGQPTRSSELGLYNDGYIWRYSDYQDYLQWRTQIRHALQDNPKILDLEDHEDYRDLFRENPYLYMQLVDHFVHLTLTAAFYSSVEVPGRVRD